MARTKWTHEKIKESASKYSSKSEWVGSDKKAYSAAQSRGLLNDKSIVGHFMCGMGSRRRIHTIEDIVISAKKYLTKGEWKVKDSNVYKAAQRLGVLNHTDVSSHFNSGHTGNPKYSLNDIIKSASKFKTRTEWRSGEHLIYRAAINQGFNNLYEVIGHMNSHLQRDGSRVRPEDIFAENVVYRMFNEEDVIRDKMLSELPYRPDFLIGKLIIEFDEYYGHSTKTQIEKDNVRQRALEDSGYTVIRFSENELNIKQ